MCVLVYYGLRVCRQKHIIIICDRLRKSCTTAEYVIEWNFMKIAPHPRNEELVAPLAQPVTKSVG